ncbi:hypothetical protein [Methanosarcina barkeri]|uniref:hypothetical protein n=1 Tax=Methanosarcina barkeri TaxID=2208 RepID=UPI000A6595D4|nr:hypothetical protein [Methanosarcina barkeri]
MKIFDRFWKLSHNSTQSIEKYVTPDVKSGESNVAIRHKSSRGDRIAVNSTGSNEIQ